VTGKGDRCGIAIIISEASMSTKTLILTRAEVRDLADMSVVVAAVERAFRAHGEGSARMPSKLYLPLPEHHGDFRAMPAFLDGAAGVKWVNSHPQNPQRFGLPAVMGVYILNDPASAFPLCILDGTLLTALRTGASAAVASRALARPDARSIGFVGCGVQARTMLAAHRVTHPGLTEVVASDRDFAAARAFAEEHGGRVGSVAEAAACDILCTSTPGSGPAVLGEHVGAGVHINAIGADAEGKQELDPRILLRARIFVDEPEQALHSGEINVPIHDGLMKSEDLAGTLGEVLIGRTPGRTDAAEITLFDSTGLAIQDVALAVALYRRAQEVGVGTPIDLLGLAG